jgi:hypothetical protein
MASYKYVFKMNSLQLFNILLSTHRLLHVVIIHFIPSMKRLYLVLLTLSCKISYSNMDDFIIYLCSFCWTVNNTLAARRSGHKIIIMIQTTETI